ncbi:MAG: 1-acyl-sn-glycerol-3-phosphate acyltransferase [Planctomycetaceae bacterium]|nr:1-acyl-sn-glycerol-3-phosphate acyltransferase [Planctomycetaceae bacterium]
MNDWQYQPAQDLDLTPSERLRSYRREDGLISDGCRLLWWSGVKSSLKLWHRLSVTGREHLPQSPSYVLVANHSSHLDALVLAAALPLSVRNQLFPLAAGDAFFERPATSLFAAVMLNALPVWRTAVGRHAIQALRDRLIETPSIYLLFPEGTRSRDGAMGEFKPGIGMMLAGTNVPVLPCYLHGAHAACPPGARFPRPLSIRLSIGQPRLYPDVENRRNGWEHIAHELAEDVRTLGGLKSAQ